MGDDVKYGVFVGDAETPRCAHLEPEPCATWKTDRTEKVAKQVLAPEIDGDSHGMILRRVATAVSLNILSYVTQPSRPGQPFEDFGGDSVSSILSQEMWDASNSTVRT